MTNFCPTGIKLTFKRFELKYLISEKSYFLLRQRLMALLAHDDGCSPDSSGYFVRSLYFDSLGDQALFDKLGGYDPRKKYRIRIYDLNDFRGKFEIKAKKGNFIHKNSFWINREEIMAAQKGDYQWMLKKESRSWQFLHHIFTKQMMKPVVLIDYIRDAFILPFNNTRITFDKNLEIIPLDSLRGAEIYKESIHSHKPLEKKIILEIKFDDYLPEYIKKLLSAVDVTQLSVSKYTIGRMSFSNQPWQTY